MVIFAIHLGLVRNLDNWNRKNPELGAYFGFGAAAFHGPRRGFRKNSMCTAEPHNWRAGLPGKWLRFPTSPFRTTNCWDVDAHRNKVIRCVIKDFFKLAFV